MRPHNIYILGAGGMAREVYQIYKDLKKDHEIIGFIVEKKYYEQMPKKELIGKKIYDDSILSNINNYILINAIGTPLRKNWIESLENKNYKFDNIFHPSTIVGDNVKSGSGVVICAESVLTCDIFIGKHTIINTNVNIHHDCKVGQYVTISPGVNIAGNVKIGEGTFIGIGASIIHNVNIGKNCYIGAGAVVINDIPDNTLALGIPAMPNRIIKESDWSKLI